MERSQACGKSEQRWLCAETHAVPPMRVAAIGRRPPKTLRCRFAPYVSRGPGQGADHKVSRRSRIRRRRHRAQAGRCAPWRQVAERGTKQPHLSHTGVLHERVDQRANRPAPASQTSVQRYQDSFQANFRLNPDTHIRCVGHRTNDLTRSPHNAGQRRVLEICKILYILTVLYVHTVRRRFGTSGTSA